MEKSRWVWMPHPGHFICSRDCKFHLNTYVGGYIVSTVGERLPDSRVREILAKSRGIVIEGHGDAAEADWMKKVGWDDIGYKRKYETMVFKAKCALPGEGSKCCPWRQAGGTDLDSDGYNDADSAAEGHMKMCEKWSEREHRSGHAE